MKQSANLFWAFANDSRCASKPKADILNIPLIFFWIALNCCVKTTRSRRFIRCTDCVCNYSVKNVCGGRGVNMLQCWVDELCRWRAMTMACRCTVWRRRLVSRLAADGEQLPSCPTQLLSRHVSLHCSSVALHRMTACCCCCGGWRWCCRLRASSSTAAVSSCCRRDGSSCHMPDVNLISAQPVTAANNITAIGRSRRSRIKLIIWRMSANMSVLTLHWSKYTGLLLWHVTLRD